MKPLKLEMSAFGPYKDKVCIDFEVLGNQGVYLITGDTGSGKTTIFDAISFALFGVASGSRRENGSFRSDFAEDVVKTYVKLDFCHKDVFYQLERVPRYFRKKIRGEGNTVVGGDAVLSFFDQVITGDKNVTNKCIEILGINASQFKQIAMIAQGEFLDLLLADSKNRANIFRRIFNTGIYKDISDELKDKYLEKKREYEDDSLLISQYKSGIIWKQDNLEEKSTFEVLDLLDHEIKCDREEEQNVSQEKKVYLEKYAYIVKRISKGETLNRNFDNLELLESKLNLLLKEENKILEYEELLEKNKLIYENVVPKYQEVLRLEQEIKEKKSLVSSNQKDYEEKCIIFDKVLKSFKNLSNIEKELNNFKDERVIWQNKLEILEKISNLEDMILEKKCIFQKFSLLEKRTLMDKFEKLHGLESNLIVVRKNFIDCKSLYEEKRKKYLEQYDFFLSAQAGILAGTLKDNCPCPVCGSLNHPNKAKNIGEILSKEELEEMRMVVENMQEDLEKLSLDIYDTENSIVVLNKELNEVQEDVLKKEIEVLQECVILDKIDEDEIYYFNKKEIELELHGLEIKKCEYLKGLKKGDSFDFVSEKLNVLEDNISRLESDILDIRSQYEKILQEKVQLATILAVLEEDISKLNVSFEHSRNEYVCSYQELGYKTEKEYLDVQLDKEVSSFYEEQVKKFYDEFKDLNGQISVLKDLVLNKKRIDLEQLEMDKNEINKKLNDIEMFLKNINNRLSNNIKIYENIKNVYYKSIKLEKEVMIYKDLSDTANGAITGKNKLEFEQFVQAYYFDLVLYDANKRFLSMTDDRYELVRKEESLKLSDKLGLELEVMDYYTGKKRDIKSLSGGESFKAALSLALGMSDTIQQVSGGVVVDAMFIDEGFGSLDEESLDQALNAIMLLSQENCIIGIISHVNELKARIDKKIVIKKSACGSKVSVSI